MPRSLVLLAVPLVAACAPELASLDQCQDINYALTLAKDEPAAVGAMPAVDEFMQDHVSQQAVAGCAVAVIEAGEITYIGTYGDAGLVPVRVNTVFPVGSISKTITALGIMTMLEDGHIDSLDDPVGKYLDFLADVRPEWAPLTLRQLLAHATGIERNPGFGGVVSDANILSLGYGAFASIRPELTAEAMSYGGADGTSFTPIFQDGQLPDAPFLLNTGAYTNVGYSLLGAVVAAVAHENGVAAGYEDYIFRHVGLRNNNVLTSPAMATMCLMPYWRTDGDIPQLSDRFDSTGQVLPFNGPWNATGTLWGWEGPSGGWTMTIGDLARLAVILAGSERLSSTGSQVMEMRHINRIAGTTAYSLGLYDRDFLGEPGMGHSGAIGTNAGYYRAEFAVRDDASAGLAMVCNSGGPLRSMSQDTGIFEQVAEAAVGSSALPIGSIDVARLSPEARLLHKHGDLLARAAEAFRTPDGAADRESIDRALRSLTDGPAIAQAAAAGDYTTAARLLDNALDALMVASPQPDYDSVEFGPENLVAREPPTP